MAEATAGNDPGGRRTLKRIGKLLGEIYAPKAARNNFRFLKQALESHLQARPPRRGVPAETDAFAPLDGRVFAICYPDNVHRDTEPTLATLAAALERWFPAVGGVHILPERPMSHYDLWPQDLFDLLAPEAAAGLVADLQAAGLLDRRCVPSADLADRGKAEAERLLSAWYREHGREARVSEDELRSAVLERLRSALESHFNDGGFSQKTRAVVDPRFGGSGELRRLSERYALMLDYVVNHLDIENEHLEAYRRGEGKGEAFIIVSPERYAALKREGVLARTFRPRPFPLFTGLRRLPRGGASHPAARAAEMNRRLGAAGLPELDARLLSFMALAYKLENDQGLTAPDRRVLEAFRLFLAEHGLAEEALFPASPLQPHQPLLRDGSGLPELLAALGLPAGCLEAFRRHEDEVFGERFYVYTTFSESQADINPATEAGFRLVIGDLFHLLAGGRPAMLRMDAIKYLWKEIGGRNFDMEAGNRLSEVIRLLLSLAEPELLPLDEVNSPDPVVYAMGRDGGFAYLFGQVNAVPAAFNRGSLAPLERFARVMKERRPPGLVLFVMLSTHDGRSVQGLGVQRTDGYLSIAEFHRLREVILAGGGRPKFRSVTRGEIPADTLRKICAEAGLAEEGVRALFEDGAGPEGDLRLRRPPASREELLAELAAATGREASELAALPAVDFFLEWVAEGRTDYELCSTSRSAFDPAAPDGRILGPGEEAARLALAQLYVLTLGQAVPAIYFNDLLGLENDREGFEASGRPRDLNRHRSAWSEIEETLAGDEFGAAYHRRINAVLAARAADRAFYPGSPAFEFRALGDTLFLNHPYARGRHSFILGNISNRPRRLRLRLDGLAGLEEADLARLRRSGLRDALAGGTVRVGRDNSLDLELPGFGALWLQQAETAAGAGAADS